MTGPAGLGVFPAESVRIKPGAVGVETPAPLAGVTGQAVPFRMTADATFQRLTGGLSMAEQEELSTVVVP